VGLRTTLTRAAIAGTVALATVVIVLEATVGVADFVRSLALGLEVLDFGNSPSALPFKVASEMVRAPLAVFVGGAILLLSLALRIRPLARVGPQHLRILFGAVLLLAVAGLVISFVTGTAQAQRLGPLTLMVACAALAMPVAGGRKPGPLGLVIGTLLLLPFALSVGTTNPIYWQTAAYLWPWLLAIVLICWTDERLAKVRPELALGLAVGLLLLWGSYRPYGLASPIWTQRVAVAIPFTNGSVGMEPKAAGYAERLRAIGHAARVDRNTPVIDLSSGGPGTTLFLGGRSPVFPWLVGIYATSGQTADAIWRLVPQQQRRR
jgi:hypothetical protein